MTNIFAELKDQPYWWDATPRPSLPETALPARADVLVIGSGYTGLSAALQTVVGATPPRATRFNAPSAKNAIDWLSRMTPQPFAGKPIAMFGAAGGPLGTARAQYHLRQMLVFLDGRPVNKPEVMIGVAHTKDVDGKFTDEVGAKLLADLTLNRKARNGEPEESEPEYRRLG